MELRVLRYFIMVAQRKNFTTAAQALNLTQPTLSRQIQELEEELGTQLLIRGKRGAQLTEAGKYMLERAKEILELAERAAAALRNSQAHISGDVYIASGETRAMSLVAKAIRKTREKYSGIKFHIFSGNAEAVSERLEKGLADFGVFIRPANLEHFDYINCPIEDVWGLVLRKDDPLSRQMNIHPENLEGIPLICSAQALVDNELSGWLGNLFEKLDIVATYTLLYNATIMVQEGIGAAISLDGIADTSPTSQLCFRPFHPVMGVGMAVAWKKQKVFSQPAEIFLNVLRSEMDSSPKTSGDSLNALS